MKKIFLSIKNVAAILAILFFAQCAKKEQPKKVAFNALEDQVVNLLNNNKKEEAVNIIEDMVRKYPDHAKIGKCKLLLGDLYFSLKQYPSAFEYYSNYHTCYPSDERAEYAKYKATLSTFYQTLKFDCDQSITENTIKQCSEYASYQHYTKYIRDIHDIKNTCKEKLINKEIYVYNFYLRKNELKAAEGRLEFLKTNYLPEKKDLEPKLLYLECKLAKKKNDQEKVKSIIEQLMEQYPLSQYSHMVQALIKNEHSYL
jgi:outer membrane protein assembly factor BamD